MVLRGDDRVLLFAAPPAPELAAVARILIRGVVVVLGEQESQFTEFQNVMFLNAPPDAIPWRDAYFTKIFVSKHWERIASREIARLLAPGGEIIREGIEG